MMLGWGLVMAVLLIACGSDRSFDVARVGVNAPLTGPRSATGQDIVDGVRLAIEQWNRSGGVHGLHLELVARDETSTGAARRPATDPRIVLVLAEGAPLVPPDSRSVTAGDGPPATLLLGVPAAAERPAGTIALAPPASVIAEAAATAISTIAAGRGVMVISSGAPGDVAAARAFVRAAPARGIRIISELTLAAEETNFVRAAEQVRGASPAFVYVVGRGLDAGSLWSELRPRDSRTALVLAPGVFDDAFLRTARGFLEGVSTLELTPYLTDAPSAERFIASFTARYGRAPTIPAARAYDGATLGLRALAATTDGRRPARAEVRRALDRESRLDGVLGPVTFADGVLIAGPLTHYRLNRDGAAVRVPATTGR